MYPLKGELQDLGRKRGVEVDVKGWAEVMEGASRREWHPAQTATRSMTKRLMSW